MTRARLTRIAVITAMVAAVLSLGFAGGMAVGPALTGADAGTAPKPPGAVDVGFTQDMIVHHEQAVVMAQLARTHTDSPRVAALAAGVESSQLLDIGRMRGHLALWDAPALPPGLPMTWMISHRHGHPSGADPAARMPGMATQQELGELTALRGTEFDIRFLQLLHRHHEGGMPMLTAAMEHASIAEVREHAAQMAYHQIEETQAILQLLATLDTAAPAPNPG